MSARHGRGRGAPEKPENFINAWKQLLAYCRKYLGMLAVGLICAAAATMLTLAGPDKLSEMTNAVTEGISIDTDKLQEISSDLSENLSANVTLLTTDIQTNLFSDTNLAQKIPALLADSNTSKEEKEQLSDLLASLQKEGDTQSIMLAFFGLDADLQDALFDHIVVNGVDLSGSEQFEVLSSLSNLQDADENQILAAMKDLPENVQSILFSAFEVDGVTISTSDQLKLLDVFENMDEDDEEAALEALDELPKSVDSLINPGINMKKVMRIGAILAAFYACSYLLSCIQGWIMATITQRVSKNLRQEISFKINRLPISYYNQTTTGDVLSRVTNDVDTISQSLTQSIGTLVSAVILLLGSLFMMIKTDGRMTLAAVGATIIGFLFMFAIMAHSQKYFARQQKNLGALNGHIEEMYTGHTIVQAYNGQKKAEEDFDVLNNNLKDSAFKAQMLSGMMMPIMTFIGNFGYVAVCVTGGALALKDQISFGVIVAFMLYVRYFTQPLSQIAQAMQSLQSAGAASERVFGFLNAKEMEDESNKHIQLENVEGFVEFDHVKFGYEDSSRIVIHDFSAKALPGQKIAIVGPTGAGKTTMVNLLMRFHEILEGEIRIEGISTKELSRQVVHDQFCMVLQDTWLFEGTLKENLIYNTPNVSDEKLHDAIKAVGLDHFVSTLPAGVDTPLSDQLNLSSGQKQQLTIARAMIADKPMLILDEATSSVDTRTEVQIQKAMDALMENRTSFVIAHRLSTIRNADLILVMKDGDIIESGKHEELLEKNGFYAELYNSQFEQA
jgi:ATP-binding cassette subfamily B protein